MTESTDFPTSDWPVTPDQFEDWREQLDQYKSLDLPTQTDVLNWLAYVMLQRDRSQHERNEAQNRVHEMKSGLAHVRARFEKLCHWLDVDPDDQAAVEKVIEDAKSLKRFKSRQAGGKLRSGEGFSPNTLKHYEDKLADKRSQIRGLERTIMRLRDQVKALGGNPDQKEQADGQPKATQQDAPLSQTRSSVG